MLLPGTTGYHYFRVKGEALYSSLSNMLFCSSSFTTCYPYWAVVTLCAEPMQKKTVCSTLMKGKIKFSFYVAFFNPLSGTTSSYLWMMHAVVSYLAFSTFASTVSQSDIGLDVLILSWVIINFLICQMSIFFMLVGIFSSICFVV